MANSDDGIVMRKIQSEAQNTASNSNSNSNKRKRERYCCVVCKLTSSNPNFNPTYLQQQQDHVISRLERIGCFSDFEGFKRDHNHDCVLVDIKKSKGCQLLMTVNPPSGFELSLNFLPCFQPEPEQDGRFEGGWIAAASCDTTGLLLCTTSKFSQSHYYICNPFTKQWAALPPAPRVHIGVHIGFIVESFTNNNNITDCSFQAVRFHTDYQCQQFHPRTHYEVETFSSQTGEWTIQTVYSPREMSWFGGDSNSQSLYHHRRLHWLARSIVVYDPYQKKILGVIKKPPREQACCNSDFRGLGLSAGSFWISQLASTSLDIRLWQLKGYDTPADDLDQCYWRPVFKINFMDLIGGPRWTQGGEMLAVHPHHPNIVYLQLCRGRRYYLVECNLLTKTMGRPMVCSEQVRSRGDIITLDVAPPN